MSALREETHFFITSLQCHRRRTGLCKGDTIHLRNHPDFFVSLNDLMITIVFIHNVDLRMSAELCYHVLPDPSLRLFSLVFQRDISLRWLERMHYVLVSLKSSKFEGISTRASDRDTRHDAFYDKDNAEMPIGSWLIKP